MAVNSKTSQKNQKRPKDKAGLALMIVALMLIGVAFLFYNNYKNASFDNRSDVQAPVKSPSAASSSQAAPKTNGESRNSGGNTSATAISPSDPSLPANGGS